jgi:hypothetical protein
VDASKRWPRLTIRGIMGLVFMVALSLYSGMAAVEVYRDKEFHVHSGILKRSESELAASREVHGSHRVRFGMYDFLPDEPYYLTSSSSVQAPFWPRYFRRLVGRPWHKQTPCGPTCGFFRELCEFAHPEMSARLGYRIPGYPFTPEQFEWVTEQNKRCSLESSKAK